ncbi:MAG: hypothetical protein CVT49_10325 [candidate division Zixibacteria bacterium HGW-Zixibacteria-1]|nr:MAG: hypothetical protein CVT49_10325 [candidate division Zixibacteria bacterium HGW-Zixibacteria-1]
MRKVIFMLIISIVIFCQFTLAGDRADILQLVLDSAGFSRADLGYQPKGYWSRFPLDIPYRLTSFDDLFAEPLKLYDYSKTMAAAVEKYMDSTFLDTSSLALYYLTYSLGVDRKLGGFRNYSPNLMKITDSAHPISEAIDSLLAYEQIDSIFSPYDQSVLDRMDPRSSTLQESEILQLGILHDREKAVEEARRLDSALSVNSRLIIGKFILNLADIIKWRNLALRNCSPEKMQRIYDINDLAITQSDGNVYYPEIDDIAKQIDYASLHYAALKAAAITQETADSLKHYYGLEKFEDFEIPTAYGDIIFCTDSGKPAYCGNGRNILAAVNFDGNTEYNRSCGVTKNFYNPVSIHIDLGGDDKYIAPDSMSDQGSGILGIGILYDASGNDTYIGKNHAQGSGLLGVGILFDMEGNDKYKAELSGQGCGYFGIGLCFDVAGIDSFYIYGSGQGYGGVGGGIGVLADYSGDDFYEGEPSPEVFDLSDYHSEMKINGNSVQGVGSGRRGDITDGHSWAGGMGAIIDLSGNDHYLSGNWSLGCGYWFATGIAYDGTGDDIYESCYFTQGSGAHFCNGILIDEGGNDKHELYETAGAALGFGWDYTNAFLINIGGNDSYLAKMISIGCAEIRSNAFLIDIGGDDTYRLKENALGLGAVDFQKYYAKPSPLVTYYSDSKSIGGFIDIGGKDKYYSFTDSTETIHPTAADNKFWYIPARADSTFGHNNYGIGVDIETGLIPELERWK